MSKKNYTSPLFEEMVLVTEDVLTASVNDVVGDGGEIAEGDGESDFNF